FYRNAFMQDPEFAHRFVGLTEDAGKTKLSQLSRDFAKWRNRAGQLVSARNRLLKLYNMFGPAVFLDPTWAVQGLVRGRSVLFVAVWDKLYAYNWEHQPKLPSVDRAQRALYLIMDTLGGMSINSSTAFLPTSPLSSRISLADVGSCHSHSVH
ncbi:hypothetical protein FOMPIDRAFT_1119361, partial [Fomitopsis schrenkii]